MKIQAIFESQARVAAGVDSLLVELEASANQLTREQIIHSVASQGALQLSEFLLDQAGASRPSVLVFLGDSLMPFETPMTLHEGSEVVITSLISGG